MDEKMILPADDAEDIRGAEEMDTEQPMQGSAEEEDLAEEPVEIGEADEGTAELAETDTQPPVPEKTIVTIEAIMAALAASKEAEVPEKAVPADDPAEDAMPADIPEGIPAAVPEHISEWRLEEGYDETEDEAGDEAGTEGQAAAEPAEDTGRGSFRIPQKFWICLAALAAFVWILLLLKWGSAEKEDFVAATEPIPEEHYELLAREEEAAEEALEAAGEDEVPEEEPVEEPEPEPAVRYIEPYEGALGIVSTRIDSGYVNVNVSGDNNNLLQTDDGVYHLFAQEMYQSGTEGVEVAQFSIAGLEQALLDAAESEETAPGDVNKVTFSFPLNKNSDSSNLYRRFFVGVISNGERVAVTSKRYVENPSACSERAIARNDHGKKGILPAAALIRSNGVAAMGAQQAIYNMTLGSICAGSGINYTYNGKTYSFSSSLISQYDIVVQRLNDQGAQVTMVILNDPAGDASLIHPDSRGGSGHYYAFNSKEKAGIERLEAVAAFVSERYSGTGHGTVDNWIVGNEVNARADWHYMADVGLYNFAQAYADSFRIIYNAIKSQNGNARIYISIDQQWASTANAARYYSGKSFLATFAEIMRKEGDLDWHVAIHPYNVPLYDPYAWRPSSKTPHSQDAAYISMQNIDVLTDFLSQPQMLAPDGLVRSVLCSEVGYTSSQGEGIQAAAVVFGYLQAVHNSHIDGFILSRELDDYGEIAQGLALGLLNGAAAPKLAYAFYQAMGTEAEPQFVQQALAVMGVPDLNSIITYR